MPTALVPGIYDPSVADDEIHVDTEQAHGAALRLAREEGILVGVSSGANMVAAMRVANELKAGVVVTMFCDSAAKYLSEKFWQAGSVAAYAAQAEADNWP
jgi:S-sulfo-L-cysteine synthase (O-acetyl-L-serine-dependent)